MASFIARWLGITKSASKQERISAHIDESSVKERSKYLGKWVAFDGEIVIASADKLPLLEKKLKSGHMKPTRLEFLDKVAATFVPK